MRSAVALFLLFCIQSCQKNDLSLPGCEYARRDGWYIDTTITKVNGRVIREVRPDSSSRFRLSLDNEPSLPLSPCNLPEFFKKDSLRVRLSGNIWNHPLKDISHLPLELTDIEQLD